MRLGLFDPSDDQPYTKLSWSEVNTPAHQQLALEAARQGIVSVGLLFVIPLY
jgi:hypothetical protein